MAGRRGFLAGAVALALSACKDGAVSALFGRDRASPLRVGINAEYPPFESLDGAGLPVGFDIDLTRQLAARMGRKVEFVNLPWRRLLQSLSQGRLEMVVSAVAITPIRMRNFLLSTPYYSERQALLRPAALAAQPVQQLARIGVLEESTADAHLHRLGVAKRHIVDLPDAGAMERAYRAGEVDALFGDEHLLRALQKSVPGELGTDAAFGLDAYAVVLAKGEDALLGEVNAALQALREDGTLARLVAQLEAAGS
ncbi:transporter substrate-binding domain-containing protein [Crenobacter caeni]|uniref:Amino acid ABC transporter substrate-binding protein n=1 Tax=Crenobacter caeni TaxID=2705474 RepID=A0A6B2KT49_9NEIS|nr:transporter substrate-binding domain-containing protein [Crenobacter caeni]NDV13169.1 amino acid ABC transporter substrate-binding protein [Crenobacter caeni]